MRPLPCQRTGPRCQRGLTLIELMVGLTLGLIVTAGLLMLFAQASAHGQDLARSGVQIENGRYVAELLREDLRLAGFYGEDSVTGAVYADPNPCSTAPTEWSGVPLTLPTPVHGYGAGDAVGCLPNRRAGTDALALRHLDVVTVDPTTLAAGNAQRYVQYSFCAGDVASPRLVFDTDQTAFTLRNGACTAPNPLRAYVARVYYIADCNRCGVGGDSTPTLKRVDLVGNQLVTTALADGIEMLRFEYGFDIDGDGSPDTWLTGAGVAGPTSQWENVMALKVHYVVRSLDKALGSNLATTQTFALGGTPALVTAADGYARKAYSSAIRLVNPSGAREAQ